ncbi:hypothetical protein MYX84_00910 [Acidobacteria bacterium AH-259-O06]|nr:hypothetical protein [Acidobacteria bacterium AH-259-O06]
MARKGKKTGKVGGQFGNKLARRHGCYQRMSRLDRRTREGMAVQHIEATLVGELGGDPSVQEIMIIKRLAVIELRCELFEKHFLKLLTKIRSNGKPYAALKLPDYLERSYLTWVGKQLALLQALGLERRARPVQDLQSYLAETYGGEED